MGEILRGAGLRVTVGKYSVRIDDCSHFIFQDYGGNLGDPVDLRSGNAGSGFYGWVTIW